MKRVYIIVEGQTEQEFVNTILSPYLNNFNIYNITPILIPTSKTSKGVFVKYKHFTNTVKPLLSSNKNDFIVTSLVDFFRIPKDLPKYEQCISKPNKIDQVSALESAINEDINDNRFFAYIQLHEFEALLFSNNNGFKKYFDISICIETQKIIQHYDNPEDINTTPEGAPSKRLLNIIYDYDKVLYGNIIALEIGLSVILDKCSHFKKWIDLIVKYATSK